MTDLIKKFKGNKSTIMHVFAPYVTQCMTSWKKTGQSSSLNLPKAQNYLDGLYNATTLRFNRCIIQHKGNNV